MNLFITTPTLKVPHGGTRVINEWAARLSEWHDVTLFVQNGSTECNWFDLPSKIVRTNNENLARQADCVIITSPHSIHLQNYIKPGAKGFVFMQMLEHMFAPNNKTFQRQCKAFYKTRLPMIYESPWNLDFVVNRMGRRGKNYIVGNGVNLDHFPIQREHKDNYILVEGWEASNPTKDDLHLGPLVAKQLKAEGYKVLAFSQKPLSTHTDVPDEYYQLPSLERINDLYNRAKILIKATHFDNRSTAPLEAMTKATPTARAIEKGDEDLIHEYNCLRGPYTYDALYDNAKRLLTDDELYDKIQDNCVDYVTTYTWDYWMGKIRTIIED